MTRLESVLKETEDNYILPFIWQHGEDEHVIREEMARIAESGIRAVCVEARPHPDYLGEKWWQDIDAIMDEARTRGMKVWMLDDDHFPTGRAAGKVADAPQELHRLFLKEGHIDAVGPQPHASFLVGSFTSSLFRPSTTNDAKILAVVAARREESSIQLTGEFIDITEQVQDDVLYWAVPEGFWRIFVFTTTSDGGSERQKEYINVLDAESVKILIDTVYEAHYEHYQKDFGDTFAGFFSDEPGFYNDKDTFDYNSNLGKNGVDLLWHPELLDQLSVAFGKDYRSYLPLLWHDDQENTSTVRYTYMNVVTQLYAKNFTEQIGDWCRAHKVDYIGHVLEDNGVHTRLGSGAGHYFRALWGQDMSGLDVVLWQLAPGYGNGPYAAVVGEADGEFFHYGLAKLGSSLAHIDPKKKGRAMCEVYGAFGWAEGLKLMKWMTDLLMVSGINYFVPHAFSQKEFPDPDCPPHFFARGMNPQYRYYAVLNHYINRISHLISGGRHIASAAVLYHAEAEWSGKAMPFQKPVRMLSQQQIDCDVLPIDVILNTAFVKNNNLVVENEAFGCLVLPTAKALPKVFLVKLVALSSAGLPIIFVDSLPSRACEGGNVEAILAQLHASDNVKTVALTDLAAALKTMGCFEISTATYQPDLRHYHVKHAGLEVFLFFNAHPNQTIHTNVTLPAQGRVLGYDGLENQLYSLNETNSLDETRFNLSLSPYQTLVVVSGETLSDIEVSKAWQEQSELESVVTINSSWKVSLATAQEYPHFTDWKTIPELVDLSRPDQLPRFSGTFRYKGGFNWEETPQTAWLDLGDVYETAQLWVNGKEASTLIAPPYRVDVSELLQAGWNELVIDVTNTLVKNQHDFLSRQVAQEPSGLLGPVMLTTPAMK